MRVMELVHFCIETAEERHQCECQHEKANGISAR